jgi:hypothetical protein
MKKQYVNKQYTISIVLGVCFAVTGALIPSVISMPVQAVNCDVFPYAPTCFPKINCEQYPTYPGCFPRIPPRNFEIPCFPFCPDDDIIHPNWILIDRDWTVNTSLIHGPNSTTYSVTIPNVIIDAMKTKMENASLQQQNLSMVK